MPNPLLIEQYGLIGDMQTAALVGCNGAIDFLCLPCFDSPSVFAALLDPDRGGSFQINPDLRGIHYMQMYLPDTNVLLTRFLSEDGLVEISDYMPVQAIDEPSRIVRRVKAVRGDVRCEMICAPRFDYGRVGHQTDLQGTEAIFRSNDGDMELKLHTGIPLTLQDGQDVRAEFMLKQGEKTFFILEAPDHKTPLPKDLARYVSNAFKETVDYWRDWVNNSKYQGHWQDVVYRSALTLKMLTSRKYGAIIAAPTFGLPEHIGGTRNWDYRYTWIRDATFTLYALIRLGHTQEASAFMRWLEERCQTCAPHGTIQVLYSVDGRQEIHESELSHFQGYQSSRPVRIGNAAHDQLQLDIYGALLDAIYLSDQYGEQLSYTSWQRIVETVEWLRQNWNQPDAGIWEVRGEYRHFISSRVMCWVAMDRAIRIAHTRGFPCPLAKWLEARDAIYADVQENFWDEASQTYTYVKGEKGLDGSMLLMPLLHFVAPTDPRWLSTLKAIGETLLQDVWIYRYHNRGGEVDGIPEPEGAFTTCSFWYIECVARAGDIQQARFLFEKMLGYASPLALYAEELGPKGEHLGNFPQALTHLALISTACYLNRALSEPK